MKKRINLFAALFSETCGCPAGATRATVRRFPVHVIVWLAMLGVIAGCGGTASTSKTATVSSTTAAHRYTSKKFRIPLTIRTDGMKTLATEDSRNFVSWDAIVPGGIRKDDGSQYNKVRLLVPARVYPPNTDVVVKPPKRYVQFLVSHTAQGARFSDVTKLTVDGRPAMLMTATTRHGLDGSIGCPDLAADQGDGCFGMQPDIALRIAVLDGGGLPVLGWARTSAKAPERGLFAYFDNMIKSIRFRQQPRRDVPAGWTG